MKKFICVIIAALLVTASVMVMYPDALLFKVVGRDKVDAVLDGVTNVNNNVTDGINSITEENSIWESLKLENFPFYGNDETPGVTGVLEKYKPKVNGETKEWPNVNESLSALYTADGFWSTVYSFIIISLFTIPVYMILRLFPFNTLYKAYDETFVLSRPFLRGLTACACSVVSVTVTWFLYHTLIVEKLMWAVTEWAKSYQHPEVALTVTNIVIIVVAAVCVIYLLKTTLFRGSFLKSIMLSVVRSLLYILIFGAVQTFMQCNTLGVIIAGIGFIFVIGVIDMIIDPASK